jgi:hypothetical protein
MKPLSEKQALLKLGKLKADFQDLIRENYEHRAKDCLTCPVQGSCCTDAHFVNVHITRLEAVAVREALRKFDEAKQKEIYRRNAETIEKYDLKDSGDTFAQTFACPLFEKGVGCLIHKEGKPIPCIQHACYENKIDLPPDELQDAAEQKIERLNRQTYLQNSSWLSLPLWLKAINPFD